MCVRPSVCAFGTYDNKSLKPGAGTRVHFSTGHPDNGQSLIAVVTTFARAIRPIVLVRQPQRDAPVAVPRDLLVTGTLAQSTRQY